MALNFVALGPYTENEVPESLLIRWLRTHADNTTSGLPLHGQTPAFTVEAHIEKPSGATVVRACEILDPATLSTEFPDPADQTVITDGDEGWIRMPFNAGDFDELTAIPNSLYGIQLVATNGTLNLKTRDVWRPEVNVGPASAAVLA